MFHYKSDISGTIGWMGTGALLLSYSLLSLGVIDSNSLWYPLFNTAGALGVVYVSFSKKTYQPAVLNIFWVLIGIVALVRILVR